ncbi:MAG: M20 family peptidase [Halobacteriota archaeon]|nr:M20 family peptidase [Halobacteriota archaeon]
MSELLLILILGLVLLVFVLLIRAARFTSIQVQVDPVTDVLVDGEKIAEHMSVAVQFQTVSYQDTTQFYGSEFLDLHDYLKHSFPRVHNTLTKEIVEEYSLLYTWKGQDEALKPILLMAHMDVVPVEPGTEDDWIHPPFEGCITDGYIWGRGTLDFKIGVLGILEAVESLLIDKAQPKRTVYLAFGHDEEVGGRDGAGKIAALLRSRGIEMEYVLDEGGFILSDGIMPGVSTPVAMVGTAEKGYVSLELTVQTEGGHSSIPPKNTAVGILSTSIHKLENHQLPARIEGPFRQSLKYLSFEMPFATRIVFANMWLFGLLLKRQFAKSPVTNAAIRTTTAASMIESGVKENILPIQARAVVNFRILSGNSVCSVIDHALRTINDPRVKISILEGSLTSEPSEESSIESPSFEILQRTIHQIFPEVLVVPYLVTGVTDSRHYRELTSSIYRFVPLWWTGPEDIDMLHGTNERISIENCERIVRFYIQLIRNSVC